MSASNSVSLRAALIASLALFGSCLLPSEAPFDQQFPRITFVVPIDTPGVVVAAELAPDVKVFADGKELVAPVLRFQSDSPSVASFADSSIGKVTGLRLGIARIVVSLRSPASGGSSPHVAFPIRVTGNLAFIGQPSDAESGAPISPAVVVAIQDALGRTIGSATNVITVGPASSSTGPITGATTVAAVGGLGTFSGLRINKIGVGNALVATSGRLASATSGVFTITRVVPTQLTFTVQPSTTVAGSPVGPGISVAIQGAAGNTATDVTDNVTLAVSDNPGGGTLSGAATVAAVAGVATFLGLSIDKAGAGYTLRATSGTLPATTSAPFAVSVGAPRLLAFIGPPGDAEAGTIISPSVRVAIRDSYGNPVTTATDSVSLSIDTNPGGGTLSGTTKVAAVAGIATFANLSIDKAGAGYKLQATAGGALVGGTVSSTAFNVAYAAPSRLGFLSQPRGAMVNAAQSNSVTVAVQDAFGNTVTSATNGIFLAVGTNPGNANLSGTTVAAAIAGVASFPGLALDQGGNGYTLVASAGGLSGAASTPFKIIAFTAVKGAAEHTCALSTVGEAYCWGNTYYGQLGIGLYYTNFSFTTPAQVQGGLTFASISAAGTHSCGLTQSGVAYCWGNDVAGELGNGLGGALAQFPYPVAGGIAFGAIAAGDHGTCGVALNGALYCWGANPNGELGDGSTTDRKTPALVSGGGYASVAPGYYHACGLTPGGAASCWGRNEFGQLGNGSTTGSSNPVSVSGSLTFAALSLGWDHTCGLTNGGMAYCWGSNGSGQLGIGGYTGSAVPLAVPGGFSFVTISAGGFLTCGLTAPGAAYCWGNAAFAPPAPVPGGLALASINVGWGGQVCGVTPAGAGYCWGSNDRGQLGNGTTTNATNPVRVSNP